LLNNFNDQGDFNAAAMQLHDVQVAISLYLCIV